MERDRIELVGMEENGKLYHNTWLDTTEALIPQRDGVNFFL